jgi:hypothetical protein
LPTCTTSSTYSPTRRFSPPPGRAPDQPTGRSERDQRRARHRDDHAVMMPTNQAVPRVHRKRRHRRQIQCPATPSARITGNCHVTSPESWVSYLGFSSERGYIERRFLLDAIGYLRDLIEGVGWDAEYPRDVWLLRRLGHPGRDTCLRFTCRFYYLGWPAFGAAIQWRTTLRTAHSSGIQTEAATSRAPGSCQYGEQAEDHGQRLPRTTWRITGATDRPCCCDSATRRSPAQDADAPARQVRSPT